MTLRKTLFFTSSVSILITFLSAMLVFFWLVYPYNPIEFKTKILPVASKVVKQGEQLTYVSDYCKYTDLPASITRTFNNEIIFTTPTITTNRPKGCDKINVNVQVPQELPAGHFRLVTIYQYQVNPIRIITITQQTEDFEIIEATPSANRN